MNDERVNYERGHAWSYRPELAGYIGDPRESGLGLSFR